jgi:hypothetical protein
MFMFFIVECLSLTYTIWTSITSYLISIKFPRTTITPTTALTAISPATTEEAITIIRKTTNRAETTSPLTTITMPETSR